EQGEDDVAVVGDRADDPPVVVAELDRPDVEDRLGQDRPGVDGDLGPGAHDVAGDGHGPSFAPATVAPGRPLATVGVPSGPAGRGRPVRSVPPRDGPERPLAWPGKPSRGALGPRPAAHPDTRDRR